jgi:hypothetical protein
MYDDDLFAYGLLSLFLLLPCACSLFLGFGQPHTLMSWINGFGRTLDTARGRLTGKKIYAPARLVVNLLAWIYAATKPIANPGWRAASRAAICIYGTFAFVTAIWALVGFIAAYQDELLPFEIGLAPLLAGVAVGLFAPPAIVAGINGATGRTAAYYLRTRQSRGVFLKWTLNPALWINDKIFSLTENAAISDDWRAAIRLSAALYLVALIALSMYLVIVVVLALVAIAVAFFILSKVMDWQTDDNEGAVMDTNPKPQGPFSGAATTRTRHGFFGDYREHRDKTGGVTGTSRAREGFFGAYTEHRDAQGDVSGSTKLREGFFGSYAEHRDDDGDVTGTSKSREGFFGPYTEHRDADGNVTGESRDREGIFGPYTEHTPKK